MQTLLKSVVEYAGLSLAGLSWRAATDGRGLALSMVSCVLVVLAAWGVREWIVRGFHVRPPAAGGWQKAVGAICGAGSLLLLVAASGMRDLQGALHGGLAAFEERCLHDAVWTREMFVAATQEVKPLARGEDFSGMPDPVRGGTQFPVSQPETREALARCYARATVERLNMEGGWLARWFAPGPQEMRRIENEAARQAREADEVSVVSVAVSEAPFLENAVRLSTKFVENVLHVALAEYVTFKTAWLWFSALVLQIPPLLIRIGGAVRDIKTVH